MVFPSTTANFVLSSCSPSDVESMVAVYNRAFEKNYLGGFVFPPSQITPQEKYRWLFHRFLSSMSKPEIRNFKITDTSTGQIAAWARWHFPYMPSEEEKAERKREMVVKKMEGRSEWPQGANLELCAVKFGALDRMREEHVDFENAYVVYLLQVDPAYQRKGLGTMMLRYGLALADAEGRKVHIEATPEGHALYQSLGFQDVEVLTFDLEKWGGREPGINTVMVRNPQSTA